MFASSKKTFLWLAFCAAAWLALGNGIQVLVASLQNHTIDITICTSMGMKKVSQPVEENGHAPTVMKHCGNAAFAVLLPAPEHPAHLSFATPSTVASWEFVQMLGTQTERTWENAPPPLRGPPSGRLG